MTHRCSTLWMLAAALLSLMTMTGCQSGSAPGVSVDAARLGTQSDEAMLVHFDVTLSNDNREPLSLLEMHYDVSLNGRRVYSGRRSAEAVIPGRDVSHLTIPAVVRFDEHAWARDAAGAGPITWSLTGDLTYLAADRLGEILFDAGVRTPGTSFSGGGTLGE